MVISINTNIAAITSQRSLWDFNQASQSVVEKLSSGIRINSAKDNAANLALSKKLDYQTSGLSVANNNINNGISKLSTYDGNIENALQNLQKMRSLAVQAANGPYAESEREMINNQAQQLKRDTQVAMYSANTEIGADIGKFTEWADQISESEAISNGYDENHIIRTAQEFVSKVSADLSGDFILTKNLDMSELGTLTNSAITDEFTGTLDGNGHIIKKLSIDTGGAAIDNIGLFSQTTSATIENITLQDINITATGSTQVGGVVGLTKTSDIINCSSSGNINANTVAGGIVGYLSSYSDISSSSSNAHIQGVGSVGGITGMAVGGTITASFATGNLSVSGEAAGGITGRAYANIKIKDCYSTGNVTVNGGRWAGGISGIFVNNGTLIENCYATGNIKGISHVGGIAGGGDGSEAIKNSYSSGNVEGSTFVGGIMGIGCVSAENSYSTGSVRGDTNVGGAFGRLIGDATNCYTTSVTTGSTNVGGFVGNLGGAVDASNFYNNNMTTDGAGSSATTDMATATATWDTATWDLSGNNPELLGTRALNFDGHYIFTQKTSMELQVGADSDSNSQFGLGSLVLNVNFSGFDLSSKSGAQNAIKALDNAITSLTSVRSKAGSNMTILGNMVQSNNGRNYNLLSSNSIIRDTDMVQESASLVKNQILTQAATAMLQQSQQIQSQSVLSFYQ